MEVVKGAIMIEDRIGSDDSFWIRTLDKKNPPYFDIGFTDAVYINKCRVYLFRYK